MIYELLEATYHVGDVSYTNLAQDLSLAPMQSLRPKQYVYLVVLFQALFNFKETLL
jgi:hypothetical protein